MVKFACGFSLKTSEEWLPIEKLCVFHPRPRMRLALKKVEAWVLLVMLPLPENSLRNLSVFA